MLIDSFIFSNELTMLSLRLNYLNPVVDKFILVESKYTHSGVEKPLHFENNKHLFVDFLHKIEHVIVNDLEGPEHQWGKSWTRENVHRNGILMGLKDVDENDLIMISDVDEIPRKTIAGQPGGYIQNFLYYYLDVYTGQPWIGTVCAPVKEVIQHTPQKFRDARFSINPIRNAGWHFSFFMTPEEIQYKIQTFAHQEYNKSEYTDVEMIKKRLHDLQDPFDRNKLIPWGIDPTMPEFIFEHPELFREKFRFVNCFTHKG